MRGPNRIADVFPREVAREALTKIKSLVKPGGLTAVNVLIEGTTFIDMFDPTGYCPFGENELLKAFAGWAREYSKFESFGAPKDTVKRFCTLVARRPGKKLPAFSPYSVGTSMS